MDVGVERAEIHALGGVDKGERTQVVAGDRDEQDRDQQPRDVQLDTARHVDAEDVPHDRPGAIDAEAVEDRTEGVDGKRADRRDDERAEQPVEDELIHRQLEDVEAEVAVELRILDAEVLRVAEEQHVTPLAGGARSEHEGDDARKDEHGAKGDALNRRCL